MNLIEFKELQSKERKKPRHLESKLQKSCVKWFRLQYPRYVLFAVPNGGKRNAREAKIMQDEGVMPGVGDLFLMCPAKGYSGLFIEMKSETGTQSKDQKIFQEKCMMYGYKYVISKSLESFIRIVEDYLK